MLKTDFAKTYKEYYTAGSSPELIHVDPVTYLSIRGQGDPSSPSFAEHIQALYSLAYAVKFACKALEADFVVPKLEGLWWFDEDKYSGLTMKTAPQAVPRSEWWYRLLLRMPATLTSQELERIKELTMQKKRNSPLRERLPFSSSRRSMHTDIA